MPDICLFWDTTALFSYFFTTPGTACHLTILTILFSAATIDKNICPQCQFTICKNPQQQFLKKTNQEDNCGLTVAYLV